MPLLLLGAHIVGPVMTLRWIHRSKRDGETTRAHSRLTRTSSSASSPPLPSSSSGRVPSAQTLTEFSPTGVRSNAITQVRKLPGRCAIALLTALVLISQPAMGKPWSNEQPTHITFRSQICQPVSTADLMRIMGSNFDNKKMAPDLATAKKLLGTDNEDADEGYQGDDPRVNIADEGTETGEGVGEGWKSGEHVWLDNEKDTVQKSNGVIEGSRNWLPRRKILNRHVDETVSNSKRHRSDKSDNELDDKSENKRQIVDSDTYTYMRRRRRGSPEHRSQARNQGGGNAVKEDNKAEELRNNEYDESNGDSQSKDSIPPNSIHLQLFLNGDDKKQRKKLKKKLRQRPDMLSKPPPWECKFSQRQRQMSKGVFPEWILEGRCETDTCFYRVYECEAIKYTLKLLQRDPTKCNPLASLTNETLFEERWELVQKYITVGCNCVSPNTKNTRPKSRRRE